MFDRAPGIRPDGTVAPAVTAQIAASRGSGSPLAPQLSGDIGARLGDDFADVRVHTDALAGTLASAVEARAFTTGADIYFARGEYRPESPSGRELLAHELVHVVQQRGAPTSGDLRVTDPGDAFEREAERFAGGGL